MKYDWFLNLLTSIEIFNWLIWDLLTALGHHCPIRDHEAFMYAYGGIKFLTLNGKITTYLSEGLGFLHLCMLHTKVATIIWFNYQFWEIYVEI